MTAPSVDAGRNALMLTELRLPTIGRLWPELAQRSQPAPLKDGTCLPS